MKKHVSGNRLPGVGEEYPGQLPAESLFDPAATARIVALWVITPTISVVGAYALFSLLVYENTTSGHRPQSQPLTERRLQGRTTGGTRSGRCSRRTRAESGTHD